MYMLCGACSDEQMHHCSDGHPWTSRIERCALLLRAALSDNVKDKPVGVEILGEKVVLFREASGKVGVGRRRARNVRGLITS